MVNYKESLAYDLSLFEPQVVEPRRNTEKTPVKKQPKKAINQKNNKKAKSRNTVRTSAAPQKRYNEPQRRYNEPKKTSMVQNTKGIIDSHQVSVERKSEKAEVSKSVKKAIFATALLFTLVVVNLFMYAECDKLDSQIASVQKDISIAESETVRLNAELNSLMDTQRVARYAEEELGMVKAESYQITYIDLSKGDEFVVSGDREVKNNEDIGSSIKALFAYIF